VRITWQTLGRGASPAGTGSRRGPAGPCLGTLARTRGGDAAPRSGEGGRQPLGGARCICDKLERVLVQGIPLRLGSAHAKVVFAGELDKGLGRRAHLRRARLDDNTANGCDRAGLAERERPDTATAELGIDIDHVRREQLEIMECATEAESAEEAVQRCHKVGEVTAAVGRAHEDDVAKVLHEQLGHRDVLRWRRPLGGSGEVVGRKHDALVDEAAYAMTDEDERVVAQSMQAGEVEECLLADVGDTHMRRVG